ncbi:MAG: hypothetical protein GXO77_05460 [Calditrichaeota bacterium]|nr:hypothetical protein [Calditrichota bacterium]
MVTLVKKKETLKAEPPKQPLAKKLNAKQNEPPAEVLSIDEMIKQIINHHIGTGALV